MQMDPILIVTVTKIETQSVLKTFAPTSSEAWKSRPMGMKTYYELGIHGNVPVFMVQSEMGSATPGGAISTVSQAIQRIQPQAVIMCGIAFGLRPDKQKLGDILVAKQILCYEPQKIDGHQGKMPRGDRVTASTRLLDRFRSADNNWAGVKTHFGLILSGEKLVNDQGFRNLLLQSEPEAIGGEMEGAGLYVAARDADAEWIMVKAVCDWGDGTKNNDSQSLAAENAARFVLHVLQQGGFSEFERNELSRDLGTTHPTRIEDSKQRIKYEKAVFVSYAWGGESERIVDELEQSFSNRGIGIVRDKKSLKYKGSIEEFEQQISQGQCIILVISDKYLRSEHCMYELVKIDENQEFRKRVFPIVLDDAHIYKTIDRLEYIRYWDERIAQLNQALKQVPIITNLAGTTVDIDKFALIRAEFARLVNLLGDMNALTPKIHVANSFSTLIDTVEAVLTGKVIQTGDSSFEWLKGVGLKDNPFCHLYAEDEPYLSRYFLRFPDLETVSTQDLTSERKTWIFWGKEGSGKTTLRKFLAIRVRPQKPDADILGIEIDQVKFVQLLSSIDDISEFRARFLRLIYETSFQSFPDQSINKTVSWHSEGNLQENLANLAISLRQHGINRMLCLIDPGQDFFTWKRSQTSTASLLAPLLSFPEIDGISFRYFLPEFVKDELQKTFSALSRSQRRLMQIEWDGNTLKTLIGKRMITSSSDQLAPYRSLGELCDDDKKLSGLIDAELAILAQGNPRGAIWLANRLIEMHCQGPMPASRISAQTWDDVKLVWSTSVESRILGIPISNKFRVLGDHIFFRDRKIILSRRPNKLVRCFIQAKGGFCTKEELIMAGWPGDNLAGVSEKSLSEAIRHLEEELNEELENELTMWGLEQFDWIKSVRGRGYRLIYPDAVAKDGEEEYD
jgi:nucleoside phosphorylase/DNA-binding winged helix-turn-helix (wHTH) protein